MFHQGIRSIQADEKPIREIISLLCVILMFAAVGTGTPENDPVPNKMGAIIELKNNTFPYEIR